MASKELLNYKDIFNNKTAFLLSLLSLTCLSFASSINKRGKNYSIKESQNFCCAGCGRRLPASQLEVHHIIPKSIIKKYKKRVGKDNLIALGTSVKNGGCGCHDKWDKEALSKRYSSLPTPS